MRSVSGRKAFLQRLGRQSGVPRCRQYDIAPGRSFQFWRAGNKLLRCCDEGMLRVVDGLRLMMLRPIDSEFPERVLDHSRAISSELP